MKLLCIDMTFAIDSPKFSLTSLQKIVICNNNSIYTVLNPSFDAPIFSTKDWNNRALEFFLIDNIKMDKLAFFIYK